MNEEFQIGELVVFMGVALTLMVPFIVVLGFMFRNRHIRHLREKQELQHIYHQEILKAQIEIQQQTLRTVSQEIHDNIGRLLSIVKIHLNIVEESPGPNPHLKQIIETNGLVSRIIEDLRHLVKGVNPEFVQKYGLIECVRFDLERLRYTGVFDTKFQVDGTPYPIDKSKEFVLYRVIQETTNNIIKHSKAKEISVAIGYSPSALVCTIVDNGEGFDTDQSSSAGITTTGSGIRNMQKRMEMIGGLFTIKSILHLGTNVHLSLPARSFNANKP